MSKCAACGGFYNQKCSRWPECRPETDETTLEQVAEQAADKTVRKLFTSLGVDISTPAAMISVQSDFAWVRTARYTTRKLRLAVYTAILGLIVSGLGTLLWAGLLAKAG